MRYDEITFPASSTSWFKAISNWWSSLGSEEKKIKLPTHEEALEESLFLYLTEHKDTLAKFKFTAGDFNYSRTVNDIYHIFKQLCDQRSFETDHWRREVPVKWASNLTKTLIKVYTYIVLALRVLYVIFSRD